MNLGNIDTRITFYTGVDSNNYTAAQRLLAVNQAIDEIETLILRAQDNWEFDDTNQSAFPLLTANLSATVSSYDLPTIDSNVVQVKRVEVSYDGTNFVKAENESLADVPNATDATSVARVNSTAEPKYNLIGSKLILKPTPASNVSSGLRILIGRLAVPFTSSDYTTGTAVPGFNRMFHDAIAVWASYDYAFAKTLACLPGLASKKNEFRAMIADWYSHKSKDKKYSVTAKKNNYK